MIRFIRLFIGAIIILAYNISITAGERDIRVLDPDSRPVAGVAVSVISPQDSIVREAVISDASGVAVLSDTIAPDNIILTKIIGFEPRRIIYAECGDTIRLRQSATDLKEVIVLGNKDQVRTEAGKLIFTPGNLKTQVSNAMEMLQYVPLVSIEDKQLIVIGKAAHILINGREPQVPQEQVKSQLMGTPPSWIKSIEVITTPGSSYSASGTMGLINVNMVDNRKGAWVYLTLDGRLSGSSSNVSGSSMIYFSHKGFRLQASGYGQWYDNDLRTENLNIYNPDSETDRLSILNKTRNSGSSADLAGTIFMSYDLTGRSRIGGGISVTGARKREQYDVTTLTTRVGEEETQATTTRSVFDEPWGKPRIYYKLYYTLDTDRKGSHLEVTGIYRHENSKSGTAYDFAPELDESRSGRDRGGSGVAKYTHVFNERQTLKGGYSFQSTRHSDIADTPLQNTAFGYDETINAAYLELTSVWSDVFSTTAGVRMESDHSKGTAAGGSLLFDRRETDIFPTLNLTFSFPGGNHSLILSASRRIQRPAFHDLNPYILWTSDNSCTVGNPELKSSKPWSVSAMYVFHKYYILSVNYSSSKNSLSQWIFGKDGINFMSRMNSPMESMGLSFNFNKELTDIWRFRASASFSYNHQPFSYEGISVKDKGFQARIAVNNSLFFRNKYIPKISINGLLARLINLGAIGSNWFCQANINVSKNIINNLNVALSMGVKPLNRKSSRFEQTGFIRQMKYMNTIVSGSLTLSYYFGRTQIKTYDDAGDDSYNYRF